MEYSSPPSSASPTSPTKRRPTDLSIDLSDIPALIQPSPPSNTLLITNLQSLEIFASANLESIQRAINEHAAIHAFCPLKSFRRIVVSFYTVDDAIAIRKVLDGETVLGNDIRVYFGSETKINLEDQHLRAPKSDKLFFISPPPSPPMGWEMRNEEPPNKDAHAEDLAAALARLQARPAADAALRENEGETVGQSVIRQRSGSATIVYDPQHHGYSPALPAIAVEDTGEDPGDVSPMEGVEKKFVHTSRPPVELMHS